MARPIVTALLLMLALVALSGRTAALTAEESGALQDMVASWPFLFNQWFWDVTNMTQACAKPWQGIQCVNGHVTSLNLQFATLSGTIPNSIGELYLLGFFLAPATGINGTIPSTIGNLTHLSQLDLSSNALTGTVPAELNNCTILGQLFLSGQSLNGSWNFPNLTELQQIDLGANQFSGPLPDFLGLYPALTQLLINGNQFTGTIPNMSMLQNRSITTINYAGNQLSGTIPLLPAPLTHVTLSQNRFSGLESGFLADIASTIVYLDLHSNNLVGDVSTVFNDLPVLSTLDLHNNVFGSAAPQLSGTSAISTLTLSNASLVGNIPSTYANFSTLFSLDLSNNQINGSIPVFNSSSLTYIYLQHNQLTGSIPEELNNITTLSTLSLSFNQLSGSIPPLTHVPTLNVDSNQLSGALPNFGHTFLLFNASNNNLSLCQGTAALSTGLCDISHQQTLQCGCNSTALFYMCTGASNVTLSCPAPTTPPAPVPAPVPVTPPTPVPVPVAPVPTPVPVAPVTPPAPVPVPIAPQAPPPPIISGPPAGCINTPTGFSCISGYLYHPGSYTGTTTGTILFDNNVVIGTNSATDIVSFSSGTFQWVGSFLFVEGTLFKGTNANWAFFGLSTFGAKRDQLATAPAVVTSVGCMSLSGSSGIIMQLQSSDYDALNGKSVTFYQTNCSTGFGTLSDPVLQQNTSDCRTMSYTASTNQFAGTDIFQKIYTFSLTPCPPAASAPVVAPVASSGSGSPWWIGLIVAIVVILVLVIAAVLIIAFVPAVRDRVVPIFRRGSGGGGQRAPARARPAPAASAAPARATAPVELDDGPAPAPVVAPATRWSQAQKPARIESSDEPISSEESGEESDS